MVRSMAGAAQNIDPYAVWPHNTSPVQWHMLFVDAPQSGTFFELLAGTGLSLAALGAALLLGRGKRKGMLTPFATVGKISLTMYGLQFILAWGLQLAGIDVTSLGIGSLPCGGILTAVVVLAAGVLLARANGGILERMVRRFEGVFC